MCVLQPAEQPLVRALFMGDLWGRVKYRKTCFLFCTPGSCLLTLSLSIKSRKWIFFSFTSGENHAVRVPLFSFLLKQIVYSQTWFRIRNASTWIIWLIHSSEVIQKLHFFLWSFYFILKIQKVCPLQGFGFGLLLTDNSCCFTCCLWRSEIWHHW